VGGSFHAVAPAEFFVIFMRLLSLIIIGIVFSTSVFADELTEKQCIEIGGTFTDVGCIFPDEKDIDFYKNTKVYSPSKKECECLGGRWHEKYGCIARMTEEQCKKLGGHLDPELGCKKTFTKEQCEKLGGSFKEGSGCDLKDQENEKK
jgi:hypothetical protein